MIKLDNKYAIFTDSRNYKLVRGNTEKLTDAIINGTELSKQPYIIIAYCDSLKAAVMKYEKIVMRKKLRDDIYTLQEAVEMMAAETDKICKAFDHLPTESTLQDQVEELQEKVNALEGEMEKILALKQELLSQHA